jgi:hypothetical protein
MKYKDKFKEKTFYYIDYGDFEQIIREEYGVKNYEFAADVESSNDSNYELGVGDEDWRWGRFEEADVKDFVEKGEYAFIASTLMQDMYRKGLVPKGTYLINVSW